MDGRCIICYRPLGSDSVPCPSCDCGRRVCPRHAVRPGWRSPPATRLYNDVKERRASRGHRVLTIPEIDAVLRARADHARAAAPASEGDEVTTEEWLRLVEALTRAESLTLRSDPVGRIVGELTDAVTAVLCCPDCDGTGHLPDVQVNACQTDTSTPEGAAAVEALIAAAKRRFTRCPTCDGTGRRPAGSPPPTPAPTRELAALVDIARRQLKGDWFYCDEDHAAYPDQWVPVDPDTGSRDHDREPTPVTDAERAVLALLRSDATTNRVMALLSEPAPPLWTGVTMEPGDDTYSTLTLYALPVPPGTAVVVREKRP